MTEMNIENAPADLAKAVLEAFRKQIGKQVEAQLRAQEADADLLTLAFRPKGGKQFRPYIAVPLPVFDAPVAARLIRDWQPEENMVVITPYVANAQAKKLKEAGIPFLDAAGNTFLAWPGFFAFIIGNPPATDFQTPQVPRATRMFKPTGLQVLFVLLARPEYLARPYRDIAKAADVALGTVGWVMTDLKTQGFLREQEKNGKRFMKFDQLLEDWVTAYIRQLYPRRTIRRFRAENPAWWETTELGGYDAQWGGDVAGDRLTGHLKPAEVTIYAKGIPGKLLQAQRMRADPEGNVTVVEAFWNFPPNEAEGDVVPPLLVYADLMATGDPRAVEVAKLIYDRHLAQLNRKN